MLSNLHTNHPKAARLAAVILGILPAYISLIPQTTLGVVLGWLFAFLLVVQAKHSKRLMLDYYLTGLVFHVISFYWLPETLVYFGGFPLFVAYLIHTAFCLASALQFTFCAWVYNRLSRYNSLSSSLALPLAWLASEFLFPRLFPWAMVHSQAGWPGFAHLSSYFGIAPVGALMVWWMGLLYNAISKLKSEDRSPTARGLATAATVLIVLVFSVYQAEKVRGMEKAAPKIKVALIQGNLEAKLKNNLKYFLPQYCSLSRALEAGN